MSIFDKYNKYILDFVRTDENEKISHGENKTFFLHIIIYIFNF